METMDRLFSLYQPKITDTRQKPVDITLADLVRLIVNDERVRQQTQLVRVITREEEQAAKPKPGAKAKGDYLQWVIIAGTFSYPKNSGLTAPSYLMVLDIDHLNAELVEEVKETLFRDDYLRPLLVFRSPRGNGVKAIISYRESYSQDSLSTVQDSLSTASDASRTAPDGLTMAAWHRQQVERAMDYWNVRYAPIYGQEADPCSTDLKRSMWICHDPQALYR